MNLMALCNLTTKEKSPLATVSSSCSRADAKGDRRRGEEARGEIDGERWEANGQVKGEIYGERWKANGQVEGDGDVDP